MADSTPPNGLIRGEGHILIGGTGRSGTTLLVRVLTHLNFDTGFSPDQAQDMVDPISRAGLETRLIGDRLPYVIKSPWLADEIEPALRGGFKVEAAIIPLRDLYEAAESRRQVYRQAEARGKDPLTHPGSLWKTREPEGQEAVLTRQLYKFLEPLVKAEVPLFFLSFPRLAQDGEYFHRRLEPLFTRHGVGREEVLRAHRRIADPGLVSRFPAPGPAPRPAKAAGEASLGDYLSPAGFWRPEHICDSAWLEHAPLAFWIMEAARPRVLVELGSYRGYSFFAFCQAVRALGLSTRCHAVDTWKDALPVEADGEEVFQEVSQYHREHYPDFARLLRMSFDQALPQFPDGSVDLLHIDGLHVYEAVSHDYLTWLPKLSPRGVVLFHDTAVKDRNFGVYRLWEELAARHPHFEFPHGYGLGVLAVGPQAPPKVRELCQASADPRLVQEIREAYQRLGAPLTAEFNTRQTQDQLLAELQRLREQADLAAQNRDSWQSRFNEVVNSTAWRITRPLRALGTALKKLSGKIDSED